MMTGSNPIRAPGGAKDSTITGPVAASIFDAAFNGNLPTVQALFNESDGAKGASILSKRDENDRTSLHWACSGSRPEVAEWLLKDGADANAADDSGWTPLIIAASVGSAPLVNLLVAHGADVNRQNETGQTALHYCASKNRTEVRRCRAARRQRDPNSADQQGQLPIHRAASLGHLKLVQLLHGVGKYKSFRAWVVRHVESVDLE
ncbi:hypothetical protein AMAG_11441 [Allomyces macrogynus ATCC 38327]|uniref:Uncharacterized protein n=1 Tax=Allomyces macrogynus (strain ATCC 38327) TaxID=578462 RepID=A0A0L0SWQ3_ALLM3|nr:hypothetical protein AMAG_11441 [Allomyces macrogynus ATCC 38327]|eukprot:KNE66968.1 hypothetical protein AMAG_11441 [Allomyces macrogynus ATCC 38327]